MRVTSPDFEVYTTQSVKKGRDTALHFEQVRDFFERTFNMKQDSTVPVRIILFSSEEEFMPFRPTETAAAFYMPGFDRNYVVMGGYGGGADRVAIHEYVHLLVEHSGMRAPVWFNEGLAELFSTLMPVGSKVQIGALIPGHFYAVQEEKWIPLARLLEVKHGDPEYRDKTMVGAFYAESWALTHMLQLSAAYSRNYNRFVMLLDGGTRGSEALEAAFGMTATRCRRTRRNRAAGSRRRPGPANRRFGATRARGVHPSGDRKRETRGPRGASRVDRVFGRADKGQHPDADAPRTTRNSRARLRRDPWHRQEHPRIHMRQAERERHCRVRCESDAKLGVEGLVRVLEFKKP